MFILIWFGACKPPEIPEDSGFVEMPAGSFEMGCTEGQNDCYVDFEPVVFVELKQGYYIQSHEVTQREFKNILHYNFSEFSDCGGDCPIETVSWHDAALYANTQSDKKGLPHCYTCSGDTPTTTACTPVDDPYGCFGYRLPTEAEWENAARCGQDFPYAGSDDVALVGWIGGGGATHPVGQKAANNCGLFDMTGNVEEWIGDWYWSPEFGTTEDDPLINPIGRDFGSDRVVRGGSWNDAIMFAGVAHRGYAAPEFKDATIGFRLVRTVPEP